MFRVREPSPEGILVFRGASALFLTLAVFWATLLPPAVLPAPLPTIFMGITLEEPPLPASVGGGGEATAFFGVGLSAGGIFSDSFAFVVGDEGDFAADEGETGDLGVGDLFDAAAKMCLFSSGALGKERGFSSIFFS